MKDKKLPPSFINGKFGQKKNETKNIGGISNANKSVRMADSIASHDSETAKRISQDLTLKFISSINRNDAKKNFTKSDNSQNDKESDSKTQKKIETDSKQPANIVPSVIKNDPVVDQKANEKPQQVIPIKENNDSKPIDKTSPKVDVANQKERKDSNVKAPKVDSNDNDDTSQLNFAALAGNMGLRPRRNLTKVLEENEDERQSPRNTHNKQSGPSFTEKISEDPASENSDSFASDKPPSKHNGNKTSQEETKKPMIPNGKKNTDDMKEKQQDSKEQLQPKSGNLEPNGTADITPAVNVAKNEDSRVNDDKQKQSKMNRMKEIFELNREKEELKKQKKELDKQKITHHIRELETDEKKEDLMKKIDDAFDELPSSSDSQEGEESEEFD